MRPSEALRAGALLVPAQQRRTYATWWSDPEPVATCALTAIVHGGTGRVDKSMSQATARRAFPALDAEAPADLITLATVVCSCGSRDVADCVVCLNDCVNLSREEIADILEGFGL